MHDLKGALLNEREPKNTDASRLEGTLHPYKRDAKEHLTRLTQGVSPAEPNSLQLSSYVTQGLLCANVLNICCNILSIGLKVTTRMTVTQSQG